MSSSTPSGRPAPASDFPRVATPRARRPARTRRVPVVLVPTRATAARASRASPRARDRPRRPTPRASGADDTIRTVRIVPLRPSHRASSTCVVERARDDPRHRAPSIHVDAPRARVDSHRASSTTTTRANAPRAFASTAIDRAREATSMDSETARDGRSTSRAPFVVLTSHDPPIGGTRSRSTAPATSPPRATVPACIPARAKGGARFARVATSRSPRRASVDAR